MYECRSAGSSTSLGQNITGGSYTGGVNTCTGHRWFAASYDVVTAPVERSILGPARARLLAGSSGRVLEVGAGTGLGYKELQVHDGCDARDFRARQ